MLPSFLFSFKAYTVQNPINLCRVQINQAQRVSGLQEPSDGLDHKALHVVLCSSSSSSKGKQPGQQSRTKDTSHDILSFHQPATEQILEPGDVLVFNGT